MTTALTGGEQTALAGPTTVKGFLSVFTPSTIATASVDDPGGTLSNPIADLPTIFGSGTWTGAGGVKKGMTVKITSARYPNTRYFRVRKDASSLATLPLAEVSWGDSGLMPAEINDGLFLAHLDAITVTDRRDLWTAIPRISGGVAYEDFDNAAGLGQPNVQQYPMGNLGKHTSVYIGSASSVSLTYVMTDIWFGSTNTPAAGGQYRWTAPGTITFGGGNTQNSVVMTLSPGEYWISCYLVDNSGWTFPESRRRIWVHNDASYPPLSVQRAEITKTWEGTTARLLLPDTVITQIPEGVMVNYFEQAEWDSSSTSVPTASTNVTGWVTSVDYFIDEEGKRWTEVTIGGPAEMLKRLGGYTNFLNRTSPGLPSNLQEIYYKNATIDYFLWYMLWMRCPSVPQLFDHHMWSPGENTYRYPYAKFGQGTLYNQLQTLAETYLKCNYGFDSTGAGWVVRHPTLTGEYKNKTQTRRDTLTSAKIAGISNIRVNTRPSVRKVRVENQYYDGATNTGTIYEAPGKTPGQGPGDEILQGIVTTSSGEGGTIAGHLYAHLNKPIEAFTVDVPYNRDVYEPAQMPVVDYQLDALEIADNVDWDKSGVIQRVSKVVDEKDEGAAQMQITIEPEAYGGGSQLIY